MSIFRCQYRESVCLVHVSKNEKNEIGNIAEKMNETDVKHTDCRFGKLCSVPVISCLLTLLTMNSSLVLPNNYENPYINTKRAEKAHDYKRSDEEECQILLPNKG